MIELPCLMRVCVSTPAFRAKENVVMKRIISLFVVLLFVACGFWDAGNACEELRKNPDLYERIIRVNIREMKELGDLEIVAVTPLNDSSRDTYMLIKSEVVGEVDLYILQEVSKNCRVTDQSFHTDRREVRRIIRQKRMKEL